MGLSYSSKVCVQLPPSTSPRKRPLLTLFIAVGFSLLVPEWLWPTAGESHRERMKRIPTLIAISILVPSLTGCFTGLSRNVGAGTWRPSTTQSLVAGALDVVTLPIQGVVLAASSASEASNSSTQKKRTEQLAELRKDPEYFFKHRSNLSSDTIRTAIMDRTIPFTDEHFRRLGERKEWTRPYLAANPRCPRDLLEELWNELERLPERDRAARAYWLASNPSSPEMWLEKMSQMPSLDTHTRDNARFMLEVRRNGPSSNMLKPRVAPPVQR